MPQIWQFNRKKYEENNDEPIDLGVSYLQTNPYDSQWGASYRVGVNISENESAPVSWT